MTMITRFAFNFFAVTTMASAVSALVESPSGFRQLGQVLVGRPTATTDEDFEFGRAVDLSDDGARMAVGANGVVSVYERTKTLADVEDLTTQYAWRTIWELSGNPGETQLGERLSLAGDGRAIAVRRDESVEVYRFLDEDDSAPMGAPVSVCGPRNAWNKDVKLEKTPRESIFGEAYWLLVSCESHEGFKGKVEILRFSETHNQWQPFSTIVGQTKGALFGWATGMNVDNNNFLLVAVASPHYDSKRGMVQTFTINTAGETTQYGDSVLGQNQGDQFGFSAAISTTERPHLVVGAPQCAGAGTKRGCVTVFNWSRATVGEQPSWNPIGEGPIYGTQDNDRFGRAVAISANGERMVATSVIRNGQSGLIRLFDRTSFRTLVEVGSFVEHEPSSQFGTTVSMNWSGSMVASGAVRSKNMNDVSTGRVQIFLDANPFCGVEMRGATIDEQFLSRMTCRSSDAAITSPEECSDRPSVLHCVWVDNLGTATPSSAPSVVPSSMPSSMPSSAPSDMPSLSPSESPSSAPSAMPSSSPSAIPSAMPSSSPSAQPSSIPSDMPSNVPSLSPSSAPSKTPSNTSSLRPSSSPSSNPSAMPSESPSAAPTYVSSEDGFLDNMGQWKIAAASGIAAFVLMIGAAIVHYMWGRKNEDDMAPKDEACEASVSVESDVESAEEGDIEAPKENPSVSQ